MTGAHFANGSHGVKYIPYICNEGDDECFGNGNYDFSALKIRDDLD